MCLHVLLFTSRSDSGVLSPTGKCCSRASTMQLAMMVVKIIHSNGVRGEVKVQNILNLSYQTWHIFIEKYFYCNIAVTPDHQSVR